MTTTNTEKQVLLPLGRNSLGQSIASHCDNSILAAVNIDFNEMFPKIESCNVTTFTKLPRVTVTVLDDTQANVMITAYLGNNDLHHMAAGKMRINILKKTCQNTATELREPSHHCILGYFHS